MNYYEFKNSCFGGFKKTNKKCKECEFSKACEFAKHDNAKYIQNENFWRNHKVPLDFDENRCPAKIAEDACSVTDSEIERLLNNYSSEDKTTIIEVMKTITLLCGDAFTRAALHERLFNGRSKTIKEIANEMKITKQWFYKSVRKTIYHILGMNQNREFILREFELTPEEYAVFFYRNIKRYSQNTATVFNLKIGEMSNTFLKMC